MADGIPKGQAARPRVRGGGVGPHERPCGVARSKGSNVGPHEGQPACKGPCGDGEVAGEPQAIPSVGIPHLTEPQAVARWHGWWKRGQWIGEYQYLSPHTSGRIKVRNQQGRVIVLTYSEAVDVGVSHLVAAAGEQHRVVALAVVLAACKALDRCRLAGGYESRLLSREFLAASPVAVVQGAVLYQAAKVRASRVPVPGYPVLATWWGWPSVSVMAGTGTAPVDPGNTLLARARRFLTPPR